MEKKIKLYKFNELDKEIQDKLVEKEKEYEYDSFCEWNLEDLMKEEAKKLLQENFKNATFNEVLYDLSYCQGCGSMISFEIDLQDLNNKYKIFTTKEIEKIKNDKYGNTNIIVKHYDYCNYYHENSYDLDYLDLEYYNEYLDTNKKAEEKLNKLIELFKSDIYLMNCELTKKGYALLEDDDYFTRCSYDYLENISEDLYFKNGDIYKGDYE